MFVRNPKIIGINRRHLATIISRLVRQGFAEPGTLYSTVCLPLPSLDLVVLAPIPAPVDRYTLLGQAIRP